MMNGQCEWSEAASAYLHRRTSGCSFLGRRDIDTRSDPMSTSSQASLRTAELQIVR